MKTLDDQLTSPVEYMYKWEKEKPTEPFLRQPYGDTWHTLTYKEAGEHARRMATALRALGLQKGDHIALISKNCYHWVLADMAIQMAGLVSVPLYPTLDATQLQAIIKQSDSKAIIIGKLDKWDDQKSAAVADIPAVRFPQYKDQAVISTGHLWDDLINKHEAMQDTHVPDLDENWTIIYTSGTTGTPKGVVHTYRSPARIARNEQLNDNLQFFASNERRFFSFLPLNHIAERTAVEIGALMSGGSISFAESIDTFAKNLQETQPTFFFAVPRLWKKFQQGVLAKMPQKKLDTMLKIPIVSGMVKKKIRAGLGLTSARCVITGASMTPEALKQWYSKLGIELREAYGMTENMGAFSNMPKNQHMPNTVGKVVANCDVRIDPETSEILMKTPWTMKEYYKDPDLTAKTIENGWMHSGDKGLIGEHGYLKIIGRVKDAFKTAKGKFIVPTTIEDKFASNEFIEQICVAGLGIPQPIALVNLSETADSKDKNEVTKNLLSHLKEVNKDLKGHERLSALIVTNEKWTDENHLLTPTLKIKRDAIHDKYHGQMEEWCNCPDEVIWE